MKRQWTLTLCQEHGNRGRPSKKVGLIKKAAGITGRFQPENTIILTIHGFIHLLGFGKAFKQPIFQGSRDHSRREEGVAEEDFK